MKNRRYRKHKKINNVFESTSTSNSYCACVRTLSSGQSTCGSDIKYEIIEKDETIYDAIYRLGIRLSELTELNELSVSLLDLIYRDEPVSTTCTEEENIINDSSSIIFTLHKLIDRIDNQIQDIRNNMNVIRKSIK